MENVRYQLATTMRKNKGSSYETTAGIVNAAASGRQAPSAGNYENYHSGRRQRSRRRDVYAAPDDFVRVSTLSPPVATVVDTVRRQVDISDVHAKSPPLWAQPTFVTGSGTATRARSRSRPRPPFLLERGVQRGEMPSDYVRDLVDNSRLQQQQLTEQSHQRQRHHQRQQHQQQQYHGAGLKPSVEFSARCAVDSRPQVRPNPISLLSDRTVTSLIPAPLSPSYVNDNKSLLKEAIISAAAAKLARSSSARSAVVKPLVVIRNGPYKSSSDEHIDADDDVTTMTVKSPVSSDRPESPATVEHPEHTADIAVAAAAAAAAAATRRSRTRRRDADQVTSSGVTASSVVGLSRTNVADSAGTRRTRAVNRDAAGGDIVSQSDVAVSLASGVKMQDAAGTRPVNSGGLLSAAQSSLSSNCDHAHDARRPATLTSTPGTVAAGTTYASETLSKTKKVGSTTNDNRKDLRQSTTDAVKMELDIQRVDKTINDNNVTGAKTTSVVTDAETRQESPSSIPKVSFIKSILSRTHSPSPSRCRRSRSKVLHASPSPSSVKRISAEVAQRISEPVKGYLKQLRDRSSQRRRPTEPATTSTMKTGDEPEPSACQDCEIASVVNSQPKPSDTSSSSGLTASSDDRSTDDMSTRGRSFRTDRQKQENGTSSLTSQWKSTSALTTPMSRLDNLLKANSLQHLQTSTTAAFRKNGPLVDETSGTPSSTSSAPPLLSKTSQSTGCLLSSPSRSSDTQLQQSIEHQRSTTMSRCYLEKPPRAARAARRAMTVQLGPVDRQSPSLSVTERQSTSQADLRNSQPAAIEEPDDSSKLTKDDVRKESADETTSEKTAVASTSSVSHSQKLHTANHASPSQNERDLRELYEQKRLERQLEEKLAAMEKERADMIAKLWSQIDRRREANTTAQQRTTAVGDHVRDSSSSSGIVLPLSSNTASPAENNNQVKYLSFELEGRCPPPIEMQTHACFWHLMIPRP